MTTNDIPLGTRVVVRYRLPAGASHALTDVIGELVAHDPLTVRRADGSVVSIEPASVIAAKALTARPIRTSEIRALEHAAALGWPGLEQEWVDGWLLRAGAGFTGRANCATPLGDSARVLPEAEIAAWFARRGLATRLLVPDRLGTVPVGWHAWDEVLVMAAAIADVAAPDGPATVAVAPDPDPEWLALYRYRGSVPPPDALPVLTAVRDGELGFGRIAVPGASPSAIARGAVTAAPDGRVWVGLTAVEVAAEHRRHGLGTSICARMIAWGQDRGATHAYLQVAADNAPAIAMYRRLGFVEHHRYRYARPAA